MQFYKHTETGNIFIITRQPSLQPNVREYIELETNNHHLITSDLLEPVTFQKAFYDEIESKYKDALHQCQSSHTQVRIELEQVKTAKEMDSIKYKDTIMNLESDLDYQKKIHEKDIDNLNKAHEANSKLSIRCNELEKAFKESQSELLKAKFDLEESKADSMANDEYALRTKNDSLKLALDKLSDLAVKFYLKSEGVIL